MEEVLKLVMRLYQAWRPQRSWLTMKGSGLLVAEQPFGYPWVRPGGHGSWVLASTGGVLAWVTDRGRDDGAVVEGLVPSSDGCPLLLNPVGTWYEKGED